MSVVGMAADEEPLIATVAPVAGEVSAILPLILGLMFLAVLWISHRARTREPGLQASSPSGQDSPTPPTPQ